MLDYPEKEERDENKGEGVLREKHHREGEGKHGKGSEQRKGLQLMRLMGVGSGETTH